MDVSYQWGCENNNIKCPVNSPPRTCIHHFHPSVVTCDDNGKHTLMVGAAPTMCSCKFAMENDAYKEEKSLCRTVGSMEDTQHTHEHQLNKNKKAHVVNAALVTVAPARDQRNNKRRYEILQSEEAKKLTYMQENVMLNVHVLHETFPKVSLAWNLLYFDNFIKLRRELKSENNVRSANQEITIYEDLDAKSCNINVSTPNEIIEENIPN